MSFRLTSKLIRSWLPRRKVKTHKGHYGHALIVAGSQNMGGAATLAAWGALRGGAGLVTAAIPESVWQGAARRIRPEAMLLPVTHNSAGIQTLCDFIAQRKITSLALGPGLSRSAQSVKFVRGFLQKLNRAGHALQGIVLDADGFICAGPKLLAQLRLPVIVTPHDGEMAKFCAVSVSQVRTQRIAFTRKFAKIYKVVCVLKGHGTVVSDGRIAFVNSTGNPGMATGGSGDVLSGLMAALVPQTGGDLLKAAAAAVFVHGLAGDLAKKQKTEIGLIAGDIAEHIPFAFKQILK